MSLLEGSKFDRACIELLMPLLVLFTEIMACSLQNLFFDGLARSANLNTVGAGWPSKKIQGHSFFVTFSVEAHRQRSDTQGFEKLVRKVHGH